MNLKFKRINDDDIFNVLSELVQKFDQTVENDTFLIEESRENQFSYEFMICEKQKVSFSSAN